MVQGVWAVDAGAANSGEPVFNVYRYPDGAVRVKPAVPEAAAIKTAGWRFDGRSLRFDQIFQGPAPEAAKALFALAGKQPVTGGRYTTVLELDAANKDRLICRITGEGLSEPATATLRRTAHAPPR